jgi:hypothetical protein
VRAAGYACIANPNPDSIARQRQVIEERIAERGFDYDSATDFFADNGTRGLGGPQPALQRLLDLAPGRYDMIVVEGWDLVGQRSEDRSQRIRRRLIDAGLQLIEVYGDIDTTTQVGQIWLKAGLGGTDDLPPAYELMMLLKDPTKADYVLELAQRPVKAAIVKQMASLDDLSTSDPVGAAHAQGWRTGLVALADELGIDLGEREAAPAEDDEPLSGDPMTGDKLSQTMFKATHFPILLADEMDDPEAICRYAALGLTSAVWRESLEPAHHLLSQAEMARISIVTYKTLRPLITRNPIDWTAIERLLLDGDRVILDGRTAAEVLAAYWDVVRQEIGAHLATYRQYSRVDETDDLVRLGLAAWALSHRPTNWFGTDWWPALVNKFLSDAKGSPPGWKGDRKRLRETLRKAPETLTTEQFQWCLDQGLFMADHHVEMTTALGKLAGMGNYVMLNLEIYTLVKAQLGDEAVD